MSIPGREQPGSRRAQLSKKSMISIRKTTLARHRLVVRWEALPPGRRQNAVAPGASSLKGFNFGNRYR